MGNCNPKVRITFIDQRKLKNYSRRTKWASAQSKEKVWHDFDWSRESRDLIGRFFVTGVGLNKAGF